MNPTNTSESNKLPAPGDKINFKSLGRDRLPYGVRVMLMARLAYLFSTFTRKAKKWMTIIASVLFGTGLLVAVATNNTQRQKILNLLNVGVETKEPSTTREGSEPYEDPSLLPSREGFWKWIKGASK